MDKKEYEMTKPTQDQAVKFDTEDTPEIVCPHCGHKHLDSFEHNDDDGQDIECGACGGEFTLRIHFCVTYSTKKI